MPLYPKLANFYFFLIYSRSVCDERPKGPNEKRTRNLKLVFPISREEGEIWILFLILRFQLSKREGEGNFFVWSSDLERESEKKSLFSISDREVRNAVLQFLWRERKIIQQALHFRNKKEKWKLFSQVWKGETDFESSSSRFPERVHSPIGCICLSVFSCPGSSIPTPRKDNCQEPVYNYQGPVDNR